LLAPGTGRIILVVLEASITDEIVMVFVLSPQGEDS
jgi:hypothetical protein